MAGAIKKPVNVFKLKNLGVPSQVFNFRLVFAVLTFGLMGAARGVDEGLISGALKSKNLQSLLHLSKYSEIERTNITANIVTMVLIGSVGGALIAFFVCDRIGRLWATRQLCILWLLGIAIFMSNNGSLAAVYAGRFIAGLGIGQTVVVAPVYLAEISPAPVRGLCTCIFTGFVYLGIVLAYFANYGSSVNLGETTARWEVPTSLHIMFASIIFILSWFQIESPRYLIKKGQREKALANLVKLRGLSAEDPYVIRELGGIEMQWQEEQETFRGKGAMGIINEIMIQKNLYRLHIGILSQILSQWSGAGSITIYAANFFTLVGIAGTNESLLATAIFGVVKLIASVTCALFLVDVIGRKRSLLSGIALQSLSMLYIACFLTAFPKLVLDDTFKIPNSGKGASTGAIIMIFVSGVGWALGWNSMQYLLTAELFPLRIRAVCTSVIMCAHFLNQYGNTRGVPNMLLATNEGGITPQGTFWCFFAVTVIGGLWVWFFVPETAGRSLESMDRLFALPWYQIGRHGNRDAEAMDEAIGEKEEAKMDRGEQTEDHVSKARA